MLKSIKTKRKMLLFTPGLSFFFFFLTCDLNHDKKYLSEKQKSLRIFFIKINLNHFQKDYLCLHECRKLHVNMKTEMLSYWSHLIHREIY